MGGPFGRIICEFIIGLEELTAGIRDPIGFIPIGPIEFIPCCPDWCILEKELEYGVIVSLHSSRTLRFLLIEGEKEKKKKDRQTDRQTDGRTDGRTDRQMDRQADRQADRQTDRQADRQAD